MEVFTFSFTDLYAALCSCDLCIVKTFTNSAQWTLGVQEHSNNSRLRLTCRTGLTWYDPLRTAHGQCRLNLQKCAVSQSVRSLATRVLALPCLLRKLIPVHKHAITVFAARARLTTVWNRHRTSFTRTLSEMLNKTPRLQGYLLTDNKNISDCFCQVFWCLECRGFFYCVLPPLVCVNILTL